MNALPQSPDLSKLPAFAEGEGVVNAIVDTAQGSRNKFKYEPKLGLFTLRGVMPLGAVFPFEFGFIPSTLGEDGDPLDILILLDAPTFVGCLVRVRLVGVLVAKQTEQGKTERNDRLVGIAVNSKRHEDVRELKSLPKQLLTEMDHFFVSYNTVKGKVFKPLGRQGPARALALVRKGMKTARREAKMEE